MSILYSNLNDTIETIVSNKLNVMLEQKIYGSVHEVGHQTFFYRLLNYACYLEHNKNNTFYTVKSCADDSVITTIEHSKIKSVMITDSDKIAIII